MTKRIRKSILGRKLGMSQFYAEGNVLTPVTLIEAGPCAVLQLKTEETDGYEAIQVGFSDTTHKRVRKPQEGLYKKVGTAPKKMVREVPPFLDDPSVGDSYSVSIFEEGTLVDVGGTSKGRGFTGNVKRWNHQIGPKSHGSKSKRVTGSIGMHQDPGRVIKGKKMPGQYGNKKIKARNLTIMKIDAEKNLLVIKGAVPGPNGGLLYIEESL